MENNHPNVRDLPRNHEFLAGQAGIAPASLNAEKLSVDVVWYTGIDIPRYDWWTEQPYVLRFDPKGADLSLLNNGAPVLDNHSSWDGSASQKGKVEKAWKDDGLYKATLRFSKRKTVEDLWGDIEDGIITKFSMGVDLIEIEKLTEQVDGKTVNVRLAKKWRPFELSVAPIPADFGTTTLAAREAANPIGQPPKREDTMSTMSTTNDPGTVARTSNPPANQPAPVAQEPQELIRQGAEQEAARQNEMRADFDRAKKMHPQINETLLTEHLAKKTSALDFSRILLTRLAEVSEQNPVRSAHVTRDASDTRRELMSNAITRLMDPSGAVLQEKPIPENPFGGLRILRIAEESVRQQYGLAHIPSRDEVVRLSMQNTADFPLVLENSARKMLLARYAYAAPTYRLWTKPSTTPDFKTMSRLRLGETPEFLGVPEGVQITIGTMTESRETYAISTYGRGVSFTRQMLINDDLGAFNDLIAQFGIQAARLENKTVYAILSANANMSDGVTLFHANHGNLGTGVIGNTGLDAMFVAMGTQKGLDAKTLLNLTPRFLIVGKGLEVTARTTQIAIGPNVKVADQNFFAGRLEVVADAEVAATVWFGAADPGFAPGIEYAHLEGSEGPQIIRKDNEQGILGVQLYAFLDFGAKAVDWRSLYKSSGV